jgi:beta-glucanase (GH16 family)
MKKNLFGFGFISLLILAICSCNSTGNKKTSSDSKQTGNDSSMPNNEKYKAGPDYKMAWADEFEAAVIDTNNWNLQLVRAGQFNDEWQRYTNSSENAYIEDGCLVIRALHESELHDLDQYTSARVNSANKQSWKYGKLVARMKLPYGKGIWPAFWTLGANINENGGDTPWPHCGEIDILELYGSVDDGVVKANIHYSDSTGSYAKMGAVPFKLEEGKFADKFHIFELDWTADSIAWKIDGKKYTSIAITDSGMEEFHKPHFILFNIAVGGRGSAGRPDASTVFPQHMYIDWVRVYKKMEE